MLHNKRSLSTTAKSLGSAVKTKAAKIKIIIIIKLINKRKLQKKRGVVVVVNA